MAVKERLSSNSHPETQTHRSAVRSIWDALVHPVVRLPVDLPWGLKQFSLIYLIAAVWYIVGSLLPLGAIFILATAAVHLWPEYVVELVMDKQGHPSMSFMLVVTIISFICGFGAELWFFNRQLKKEGLSIRRILHLNLASLNGSWGEAFKRSLFALVIGLIGQFALSSIPHVPLPHQATADMAAGVHTGFGLLAFAGLAAVLAPFFEEIIFRGFLFNSLRKIFREGKVSKIFGSSQRLSDYAAVIVSAAMFAGAHMDPTAFTHLFLLGIILAELYRRSGTLSCSILLHAMNNLVATLLIIMH